MANMSYCRFQNTLQDLRDCEEHLNDDLSPEEDRARKRLIELAKRIAAEASEDEEDDEDEE